MLFTFQLSRGLIFGRPVARKRSPGAAGRSCPVLDEVVLTLRERHRPLVLVAEVAPDTEFTP